MHSQGLPSLRCIWILTTKKWQKINLMMRSKLETSPSCLHVGDVPFGDDRTSLLCDISTGQPQPIVPASWSRKIFDNFHSLSHPSIRSTQKLIANKFVWKGLKKQIHVGVWAKQCIPCQTSKIQTHVKAPLEQFEVAHRRFDRFDVDLVGPLSPSNGYTHLLTIVDRFSRWPEATPLCETTSTSCAQALVTHWTARFGVPLHISPDRITVHFSTLGISLTIVWHASPPHNSIPPAGQWTCRTVPSSFEIGSMSTSYWSQLDTRTLLGIRNAPKQD